MLLFLRCYVEDSKFCAQRAQPSLCCVVSLGGGNHESDVRADVAGICALSVLVLQTQLLGMNAEPAHKGKLQGIH